MRRLTSCGSTRSGRDDFAVDLVVFCASSRRLALLIILLCYDNFPRLPVRRLEIAHALTDGCEAVLIGI